MPRESDTHVRILTRREVESLLTMADTLEGVKQAYAAVSAGQAQVPPRHHLSIPEQRALTLVMSGYLPAVRGLGVKVVSGFPGNADRGLPPTPGALLLLDPESGIPDALMDGTLLTAIRTGAGSGVATDLLASPDAAVAAILGAGAMAWHQLEAVCAVRPIVRSVLWNRTRAREERLAAEAAERFARMGRSMRVDVAETPAQAVREADVICAATASPSPVVRWEWLRPGAHVNVTGSHGPDMQEVDEETVARAAIVCVDSRAAALGTGDLSVPLGHGRIREDDVVECGELLLGRRAFARRPGDVTLFKSVGIAAQDLAVGRLVLARARERGVGAEIDLLD